MICFRLCLSYSDTGFEIHGPRIYKELFVLMHGQTRVPFTFLFVCEQESVSYSAWNHLLCLGKENERGSCGLYVSAIS
jgi:hypothetical protein